MRVVGTLFILQEVIVITANALVESHVIFIAVGNRGHILTVTETITEPSMVLILFAFLALVSTSEVFFAMLDSVRYAHTQK